VVGFHLPDGVVLVAYRTLALLLVVGDLLCFVVKHPQTQLVLVPAEDVFVDAALVVHLVVFKQRGDLRFEGVRV